MDQKLIDMLTRTLNITLQFGKLAYLKILAYYIQQIIVYKFFEET